MVWSPSTWSTAKHTDTACMFVGCACSGALGSPVSARDSKPVTYSVPVSGSNSPVSVASSTYGAVRNSRSPVCRCATVTPVTRSPSVSAATGRYGWSTRSRPDPRYGPSMASSTATATRGSWQSRLTCPAPGLSAVVRRARSVSGYQRR